MGSPAFPDLESSCLLYVFICLVTDLILANPKWSYGFKSKKGLKELKTMQSFILTLGWHVATFCLPSQPALQNEGATMTLAAHALTGDLQRRWGHGLILLWHLTCKPKALCSFEAKELVPASLRPLSHLSKPLTDCRKVGAGRQLSNHLFQPLNSPNPPWHNSSEKGYTDCSIKQT